MRLILVGPAAERARLRARLEEAGGDGSSALHVAAEFPTLGMARASGVAADAIVMAARKEDEDPLLHEALTAREIQVLELMAEGLPNKAIAERLHISDQTVKFHVSSISGKLGATNRTDAVRRAVGRGLIAL